MSEFHTGGSSTTLFVHFACIKASLLFGTVAGTVSSLQHNESLLNCQDAEGYAARRILDVDQAR